MSAVRRCEVGDALVKAKQRQRSEHARPQYKRSEFAPPFGKQEASREYAGYCVADLEEAGPCKRYQYVFGWFQLARYQLRIERETILLRCAEVVLGLEVSAQTRMAGNPK